MHATDRPNPISEAFCTMRVAKLIATLIIAPASFTGCDRLAAEEESVEQRAPRVVLCGIDRTGSYSFPKIGLRYCAERIHEMEAGDSLVVRWISGASYGHQDFVLRVDIPNLELPNCEQNPWNLRCRELRVAAEQQIHHIKSEAIAELLAQRPQIALRTDIYGFWASAGDLFSSAPENAERIVYAATDMVDNVRLNIQPDISGARVSIGAIQTGNDPAATWQLLETWKERLLEWGVEEVSFRMLEASQ